jgi:hypothetical protein
MALRRQPGKKAGKTKIPSTAYPIGAVIEAIASIDLDHKTANQACGKLMSDHPDVLEKYGVTIGDYHGKPGQISGGMRLTLDGLVEKDAAIYDMVVAAGLEIESPRPGGPSRPPMPAIPSLRRTDAPVHMETLTDKEEA